MRDIFKEKEIKLLRLLVGAGLLYFRDRKIFNIREIELEDAGRHFMLETEKMSAKKGE